MSEPASNEPVQQHILVVDDEQDIRDLIDDILSDEGHKVSVAADAASARNAYASNDFDLILLDIWMPDADGISLLQLWQRDAPLKCPVVMMSGHGNVETAVQATRLGALEFIEKPLSLRKLLATVEQTLQAQEPSQNENNVTQARIEAPVGKSAMRVKLRHDLKKLAENNHHCAISGPQGLRKTDWLIWITQQSHLNHSQMFTVISTAALNQGNLALPQEGTLIIERAEDLDTQQQKSLLHWVNQAQRRLMLTTTPPLRDLYKNRVLSPEFYQLIGAATVDISPLSEHLEDMPELIRYYTDTLPDQHQLSYRAMTLPAQNCLRQHNWPGNEQELADFIHQRLLFGGPGDIEIDEVEKVLSENVTCNTDIDLPAAILALPLREAREAVERQYLSWHLQQAGGSVGQMASTVGMERTHLYRKLRGLGLDPKTMGSIA